MGKDCTEKQRLPFFTWLFGRGQLKTITMLPFLVLITLSFGMSWLVSFMNSRHAVKEMMELLSAGISSRIQITLDAYLAVPVMQNRNNNILLTKNRSLVAEPSQLFPYFEAQLQASPGLNILAFGSKDGEYIEAQRQADGSITLGQAGRRTGGSLDLWRLNADGSPGERLLSRPDYDPRLRPWYQASLNSGRSGWSSVYPYYSNQALALSANSPVYDAEGDLAGVLSATFTLNDFSTYLSSIDNGPSGFIIVFEKNGDVLASSLGIELLDKTSGQRLHALDRRIPFVPDFAESLQRPESEFYIDTSSGRCLVSKAVLRDAGGLVWYTLVFLFEKDFDTSIRRTNAQTAVILGVIFILTILIGWIVGGYISWPIIRLNQATGQISSPGFVKAENFLPRSLLDRKDEIGNLANAFDRMVDDLQKVFGDLQISLQEKEALLQEINHRVKNNLQLICSMLNLQADRIDDPAGKIYFQVSQDRIHSLALLHEEFYNADDFYHMNITPYMYKLRDEILGRYRQTLEHVVVETQAEDVHLSIVQAVPFGLIIYELLTNAVMHAYAPGQAGLICLELGKTTEGKVRLKVSDNGKGWVFAGQLGKADSCFGEACGLGFTMVQSLTKQLNGHISIDGSQGFVAILEFPLA